MINLALTSLAIPLFLLLSCQSDTLTQRQLNHDKLEKTKNKNHQALAFCETNNYNTQYAFMVDLNVHSGKNRFYVWDLQNNKALDSGLVAHGNCRDYNKDNLTETDVSNINESHCSSVGKYKVGGRDYSNWGINIKYWIVGLDSTNNNAVKRVVVLHSWEVIDDEEIYPETTAESWGCPAVSDNYMRRLDALLKKTEKPVLLWIYI